MAVILYRKRTRSAFYHLPTPKMWTIEENKDLDNLGLWEPKATPEKDNSPKWTQDPDFEAKEKRYKEQLAWSAKEAERLRWIILDSEVQKASKDGKSLLELHKTDPKLAEEVAKKFNYVSFEDAKKFIESGWSDDKKIETKPVTKEDFEKWYKEKEDAKIRGWSENAAEKIFAEISDEKIRKEAEAGFKKIVWDKTLSKDEAVEIAKMVTLYANRDNLKKEKLNNELWDLSSIWLWTSKKITDNGKKTVVKDWKLVILDSNNKN